MKHIVLVKTPFFENCGSKLEYFSKKLSQWMLCKLLQINYENKKYKISYTHESQNYLKIVSFNTLKLRPLPFTKYLTYATS